MGSDIVNITYQGGNYPQHAINDMLGRLGKALGNEPRNLTTEIDGPVTKATFAVNGLIVQGKPRINIAALAVALAFCERPVKQFSVFFADLSADVDTPNQWFPKNSTWKMEGVSMKSPKGLDYRVQVFTTNPNDIYMPDINTPTRDSGKPEPGGRSSIFILVGIVLGAFAIGLLVYSALLRPRPRGR
ncbi:MAG: hypothetical protein WCG75_03740 [Armatimonadota bacterium]